MKEQKAIKTKEHFLKCDKDQCTYEEIVKNIDSSYINKPCPMCGSNLLTKQDHDDFLELTQQLEIINSFSIEELKQLGFETLENPETITLNIHKGEINIKKNNNEKSD